MNWKKVTAAALTACVIATSLNIPGTAIQAEAVAGEGEVAKDGEALRMWYDKPASQGTLILGSTEGENNRWEQFTLPIGNSYMGANIYGEVANERLTFNQKTLWNGGPSMRRPDYNGGNLETASNGKKMYEVFNQINELFMQGKDDQAKNLCGILIGADNAGYGSYQSWGDIYLTFDDLKNAQTPNDYERDLDMATAKANVDFTVDGTAYHREYFISHPDNVLAMKLTAKGSKKLNFNVKFPVDNDGNVVANNLGKNARYTTTGDTIVMAGSMQDNQMQMNSMLKVIPSDGQVASNNDGESLDITGATEVVIFVSADTDYKNEYPVYRTGETEQQLAEGVAATVAEAVKAGYDKVYQNHLEDYKEIFDRVDLDLGQTVSDKPTDQLLNAYNNNTATRAEKSQLEVMLYQFGRYLTIASSRAGDLPSNLQGVWQNRVEGVAWSSDYHMNVNLQMNYWPTYSANMAECATPLIDYVDSLREPGRVTAKTYFNIESGDGEENGFTAHTQNTPFGWTCPGWAFSWGWSPAAVPWILQNCWEYYEYTGDLDYMKENIYPMLREEAVLYNQLLIDSGVEITLEDGTKSTRLVSSPTYSPEHGPYTMGNAYEQELIWQLYEDVITAAELVGEKDTQLINTWKENQSRLAPIEIGESGQIKEWYAETTLGSMPNTQADHRHLSHLLGLFPGDLISVDNDEYMDAAIVSLEKRGMVSTGWGMGQRLNSWARTGEGDKAYQLVGTLFKQGIYPNLWDTHKPYQIDGNFGYTSGINEMLMQSNMGYVNILPSLPSAWESGSVNGIVARGNFEIGINWTEGKANQVSVLSKNGGSCTVQYIGIGAAKVTDKNGKTIDYVKDSRDRITFETIKGEEYTITEFQELPSAPLAGEAICIGSKGIEVKWDEVAGKHVTYNLYRKSTGSYEKIWEGLSDNSYLDKEEYADNSQVRYKVTAVADGAESLYSTPFSIIDLTEKGMVDNTNPRIVYEGAWEEYKASPHYGGSIHFVENSTAGDTISLEFSGTGIKVIAPKNRDRGYMEVYIDGALDQTIDFYNATDLKQQEIYVKDGLEDGIHTIKLAATGEKNPASSKAKLEFDAFQVLGDQSAVAFSSQLPGSEAELPETVQDYEGTGIQLPGFSEGVRGYLFHGWSDGKSIYAEGSLYRIPKGGITLHAVWEKTDGIRIPSSGLTAVADSEENAGTDGPASWAVDGNEDTIWHSAWSAGKQQANIPEDLYNSITVDLGDTYEVGRLEYVPRKASANGRILEYRLLYSTTESGDDFIEIPGRGVWVSDGTKKEARFDEAVTARRIQIRALKTDGDQKDSYISAAEFYFYENNGASLENVEVEGVSLSQQELVLYAGNSVELQAVLTPSNATNQGILWKSSDRSVASVEQGVVTAVKEGVAEITATTENGAKTAVCKITVQKEKEPIPVSVEKVALTDKSISLEARSTHQLVKRITPGNASNQKVNWESDNPKVAAVDNEGLVTGKSAGKATITIKTKDGDKEDYCSVTVTQNMIFVDKIELNPSRLELALGEEQTIKAVLTPANADNQKVIWDSSDNTVATVNEGVVRGLRAGDVTITATTDDGGLKATCQVSVKNKNVVYKVTFDPNGGTVSPAFMNAEEGKPYGSFPTPVRAGYRFLGWYQGSQLVKESDICKGDISLKASWQIQVKPGKVTGVKAGKQTTKNITLIWKKVDGASSYVVDRYDAKKKKWMTVKTLTGLSFKDTKRTAGTVYKYRIAAKNTFGTGAYSSTVTSATKPVKPTLKTKAVGATKVKLTWKRINAAKLELYMKTGKGKFIRIKTLGGKKTTFVKSGLKKGKTYTFKIRGYMNAEGKIFGAYSKQKKVTIKG